ncbi:helix-turn-helix domain-containing protein [Pedobacter soli]|uniref:DNA-binding transcriptional regulator, XRE-family HTH domain n=1 Tax=Pedobacter soli TaxID=390242 RepID=A0A1G6LGW6_9SPHI|nr:helix-turn-helix transcriptional regulator [Pedobacter soli]SDC41806.1 DNA-binding transcriptional regulator, XRE-family HTH domain [Pedobacter soli]
MENLDVKDFKVSLAKRIKQRRVELGLTQASLALRIGFKDKQIVNNYEIQGANPTAYNLVLIAKALDITVNDLLDFSQLENFK